MIESIIITLVSIIMILSCGTPYANALNFDMHFMEMMSFVLFLWMMTGGKARIKKKVMMRFMGLFSIYLLLILLCMTMSVPRNAVVSFANRFIIILFLTSFIFCMDSKAGLKLLERYKQVMVILSALSLFFWVFGSLFHIISPNMSIYALHGTEKIYPGYFGLYFESQKEKFLSFNNFRNIGIFCEGPLFSLNIIIALAVETFLLDRGILNNKKTKLSVFNVNWNILILTCTLISTITTTGYILLIVLFILYYATNYNSKGLLKILKWIVAIVLIIGGSYFAYSIFVMKTNSGSWLIRFDDYVAGYYAWKKSPIFGNGYGDFSVLSGFMRVFADGRGFTNSIFAVLLQCGICLFSVYGIPMAGSIITNIRSKNWKTVCFTIIVILEFSTTIFQYTPLILVLIAYMNSLLICNYERKSLMKALRKPKMISYYRK